MKAQCISIEAAKPNHSHEWKVWRDVEIPEGQIFMPGVIDHTTDVREHPEVIAERIINYASVVRRENVIARADCGMRGRPTATGSNTARWSRARNPHHRRCGSDTPSGGAPGIRRRAKSR